MTILLPVHVAAMVGAIFILLSGGVAGLIYLAQERSLRHGRVERWNRRLPAIERLQRFNQRAVYGGFGLLTFGIAVGAAILLLRAESASLSWFDSRIVATFSVWLLCGGLVALAARPRFRGRPVALLTIAALILTVTIPVVAGMLWPSWHAFFGGGGAAG